MILLGLLLFACDSERVYEENLDLEQGYWLADSSLSYEFTIPETGQSYNIYWNVRNTLTYPYQNLYLTYYLEDTLGNLLSTDLHNMLLFDPKTGEPYGSGFGDIFSHQIMALPGYNFDSSGVYRVRLEHYMRTDTLHDILTVGVRVEEAP
jgi:gliding motility-associated lipoprotein GldH